MPDTLLWLKLGATDECLWLKLGANDECPTRFYF